MHKYTFCLLLILLTGSSLAATVNSQATGNPIGKSGNIVAGNCLKAADTSGNVQDAGAPCGNGGGGSGTVTSAGVSSTGNTLTVTGSPVTTAGTINVEVSALPGAVPAAGSIVSTNIAAPSTPAAGKDALYTDATDLRLHDKNASGVIGTTVVADTGATNNFLTGITAAGAITKAQPTPTNVGLGSVTNDVQAKATIHPNTLPSAGQILAGNAGGTAYAPVTLSGSGATATLSSAGVLTLSAIPNASLSNSSLTVAGHAISLGGTQTLACADLTNGATGCSTTVGTAATSNTGTSGATIPLLNGINTWLNAQTFTAAPVFTDSTGSRTALGLGSAATASTGTSGATLPFANGANTWAAAQTFTFAPVFTDTTGTRTALGLGTAATANTGTSGANVPLANGTNTWAGTQSFTLAPVFTDASGSRTALGLGTSATVNTGTSGATIPLLNGTNTWASTQTLTLAPVFTDASGSRTALGLGTAATQATGTSGATLPFLNGTNTWSAVQAFNSGDVSLKGATSGAITLNAAATAGANTLTLPAGTTDFSATGGASQVVKQTSTGGAFTVAQLANTDITGLGTAATVATGTSGATIPLLNGANTHSGASTFSSTLTNSVAGAASAPGVTVSGVPFAGTGTTSFPQLYINTNTATASTTMNTTGTALGVNGHLAVDLINLMEDGTSQFKVTSTGVETVATSTAAPTITASTALQFGSAFKNSTSTHLLASATAPTIASGFGTGASVPNNNGTAVFTVNVGTTSATTGVVTMPAASAGWACQVTDITTKSTTVFLTKVTATSTTSVTVGNFSDVAVATAWTNSDILQFMCLAY